MSDGLSGMISRILVRAGCEITSVSDNEVGFDGGHFSGTITLHKPFMVTWKMKKGFVSLDVPSANGKTSAEFKKIDALLDFLKRRLLN